MVSTPYCDGVCNLVTDSTMHEFLWRVNAEPQRQRSGGHGSLKARMTPIWQPFHAICWIHFAASWCHAAEPLLNSVPIRTRGPAWHSGSCRRSPWSADRLVPASGARTPNRDAQAVPLASQAAFECCEAVVSAAATQSTDGFREGRSDQGRPANRPQADLHVARFRATKLSFNGENSADGSACVDAA